MLFLDILDFLFAGRRTFLDLDYVFTEETLCLSLFWIVPRLRTLDWAVEEMENVTTQITPAKHVCVLAVSSCEGEGITVLFRPVYTLELSFLAGTKLQA